MKSCSAQAARRGLTETGFVIARQNNTWIEPASVAVLIGTFASAVTLTSVIWLIQSGRLALH